jgi:2-phospho-L-lactate transferase/gluconeogenesis factor (CofD/UPF0052 family)
LINIVSFNGGRGARTLIPHIIQKPGVRLTSIVNAYDDGKSTGILRNFFGMLGPSDIRKVQEIMVPPMDEDYKAIIQLYEYRYPINMPKKDILFSLSEFCYSESTTLVEATFINKHRLHVLKNLVKKFLEGVDLIESSSDKIIDLNDCSVMNLLYAGAFLYCQGNFEEATLLIDKLFHIQGLVLPTNNENKVLVAIREDGTALFSEAEIVEIRSNSRIKDIYLMDQYPDKKFIDSLPPHKVEQYFDLMKRNVNITDNVRRSIASADIIIYSAGTQHSSLYPSYITKGLSDTIALNANALKVFVTNIGEDYETPSYTATDYILGAYKYLLKGAKIVPPISSLIQVALVNNCFSNKNIENYVTYDETELSTIGCKIVVDNFEDRNNFGKHDGNKLLDTILGLYYQKNYYNNN